MPSLKTITINLVVLVALLFVFNGICGIILQYIGETEKNIDERAELNVYEDPEMAEAFFSEYYQLKTEYHAFTGWRRTSFNGNAINIDKKGIRSNGQPLSDPSTALFGGSTVWGVGVDDEHTISAILSSMGSPTINYGETGYNSRQSLEAFESSLVNGLDVQTVIFMDGVNDVEHLCRKEAEVPGHSRVGQIRSKMKEKNRISWMRSAKFLLIGNIQRLIRRSKDKAIEAIEVRETGYNCVDDQEKADRIADQLIKNWEMAKAIAESQGMKFYAVLQPVIYTADVKSSYLEHLLNEGTRKSFEMVYPIIREKIRLSGHDWIIDLSMVFNEQMHPVFIDFCHLNERGNRIIAEQINKRINKPDSTDEIPFEVN